ncbi:MAG: hypothetical protein NW237_14015 [Cyanobacteriota bacterium]|nr:hypothetical protein [Cyanobacteriota bacterium]
MRTTFFAWDAPKFEQKYLNIPTSILLSQWQDMLSSHNDVVEVADLLDELDLSGVVSEGDYVSLPKGVTPLILAVCLADCTIGKYQILYTDFFFADLEANPPQLDGLSADALSAWKTFLKAADISSHFRSGLPWWLQEAAGQRNCFTGLLTPLDVQQIDTHRNPLLQTLHHNKDAQGLFQVISEAAGSGNWLCCLEPGT